MTTKAEMTEKIAIAMMDVSDAVGATVTNGVLVVTMLDGTQFKITPEAI